MNASAGSTEALIKALVEAARVGTMEVKERAVAAMHSLAMQDRGKGKDPGSAVNLLASTPSGLQALVSLIESGNTSTQGHSRDTPPPRSARWLAARPTCRSA